MFSSSQASTQMAAPSLPVRIVDRARRALAPRMDATPVVRHDTATTTSAYSGAAVANALSGIGGARDSGATARPNLDREYLTDEELVALLRGTVYRRIVTLLPRWSTTKGWTITDSTNEERPLEKTLRRLAVQHAVQEADTWGRALGEARILLVTDDPGRLDEPLDPAKVRAVHRLEVLDRREITPVAYNGVVSEGALGDPVLYKLAPWRTGVVAPGQHVHASRLLRFHGDELPPSERGRGWYWGSDAIGQVLWDGIRHLSQTGAGGARLAQELSIAVFKLKPGQARTAGDQRTDFLDKLRTLNTMKSIANAVFIGVEEAFERVAAAPTGFGDLSQSARLELALLAETPMALLYGEAPSGLNTDGQSWQASWHARCAAHQEERYREPLERLVEILYYAEQGGPPDEWSLKFNPLGQPSDKERADIRLVLTQADAVAVQEGILTPDEARGRYTQPGGFSFDLQPVEAPPERPAATVDPAQEEEARKIAEAALATRGGGTPADEAPPHADATEGACWIGIPLPEAAHTGWAAARAALEATTGPLDDPGDTPHVTVLYLGRVAPEALVEVEAAVREVAANLGPSEMGAELVNVFPTGEDGAPVVLGVRRAWTAESAQAQLLARLAHLVTQRQHVPYRPHLTLGYAPAMGDEQRARAMEAQVPAVEWTAARLQVHYGGKVVAVVPLSGRSDGRAS
jgi:phage-related protein (TIGR01555 family)